MKGQFKDFFKYLFDIFKNHYEEILGYSLEILKIFITVLK